MNNRAIMRYMTAIRFGAALLSLGVVGLMVARPAAAQTPAVSFTSSTFNPFANTFFSLGFSFTTGATPLTVTSVGYINDGATGAQATHQVQMYQITGNGTALSPGTGTGVALLPNPVSVTTVANAATYNTFSYVALASPLTLSANTAYEIVATEPNFGFCTNAVNAVFAGITFGAATYTDNQSGKPDYNVNAVPQNNPGNFGPNFLARAGSVAVPEAGSVSLLLSGVLALGGMVVVRRKRA